MVEFISLRQCQCSLQRWSNSVQLYNYILCTSKSTVVRCGEPELLFDFSEILSKHSGLNSRHACIIWIPTEESHHRTPTGVRNNGIQPPKSTCRDLRFVNSPKCRPSRRRHVERRRAKVKRITYLSHCPEAEVRPTTSEAVPLPPKISLDKCYEKAGKSSPPHFLYPPSRSRLFRVFLPVSFLPFLRGPWGCRFLPVNYPSFSCIVHCACVFFRLFLSPKTRHCDFYIPRY